MSTPQAQVEPTVEVEPEARAAEPAQLPARIGMGARAAMQLAVVGADAVCLTLALLVATAIRIPDTVDFDRLPEQIAVVCALMLLGLARQDAYELQLVRSDQEMLTRIVMGSASGLMLVMLGSYVVPDIAVGRGIFALHALLGVPLLLLWRKFLFQAIRESRLRPRALVLGEPMVARKIARALDSASHGGSEVVGVLVPEAPAPGREEETPPVLGGYASLAEVVAGHGVEEIVVFAGPSADRLPVDEIVRLRRGGVRVEDGADVYEGVTGKILVEKLTPGWLIFANAFERRAFATAVRRVLAVVVASLGLLALTPLLLAVAALIRYESPGPVLFRQRRVGEGGRCFELLKFRSMRQDAEAKTGAVWAVAGDPRVTRVGRLIRSTRIDELPQLWNVLKGDMYFVGPRPERPEFVDKLKLEIPHYDERHRVKPGVTGWAQINYRYGASIEDTIEKLHYDLYYIQNMSLLMDFDIVIGTIRVMVGASNSN